MNYVCYKKWFSSRNACSLFQLSNRFPLSKEYLISSDLWNIPFSSFFSDNAHFFITGNACGQDNYMTVLLSNSSFPSRQEQETRSSFGQLHYFLVPKKVLNAAQAWINEAKKENHSILLIGGNGPFCHSSDMDGVWRITGTVTEFLFGNLKD